MTSPENRVNEMVETSEQFANQENANVDAPLYVGSSVVLGVGQGGGNVTTIMTQRNFPTVAINSSLLDLEKVDAVKTIHIKNVEGSGKNSDRALEMFLESPKEILKGALKLIDEVEPETIFVVGTGTGGTGSGMVAPITASLRRIYPNKLVIAIGILGSIKEDALAQTNAKNFIKDLEEQTNAPYMLFDNDSVQGSLDDVYDKVNTYIADAIESVDGYMYDSSESGNLDRMDRFTTFKPGRISVTRVNEVTTSIANDTDVDAEIIRAIESNHQVQVGDLVQSYGIYLSSTDRSKFDENFIKVQNHFGEGLVFKHLQDANDVAPELLVIMAGLDAPLQRYSLIEKRIAEYKGKERKGLPNSVSRNVNFGNDHVPVGGNRRGSTDNLDDALSGFQRR